MQLHGVCIGQKNGQRRFQLVPGVGNKLFLLFQRDGDGPNGPFGEQHHQHQHGQPAQQTNEDGNQQHRYSRALLGRDVQADHQAASPVQRMGHPIPETAGIARLRPALVNLLGNAQRLILRHRQDMADIGLHNRSIPIKPHKKVPGPHHIVRSGRVRTMGRIVLLHAGRRIQPLAFHQLGKNLLHPPGGYGEIYKIDRSHQNQQQH